MRARVLALIVSASTLVYGGPYWTVGNGGTMASPERPVVLDRYPLFLQTLDAAGNANWAVHQVSVEGKFKSGKRFGWAAGLQVRDRYRIELETSYATDKVSVLHFSPEGMDYDPAIFERKIMAFGVNAGGHLLEYGFVSPYSLIGLGIRGSYIQKRKLEAHLYYQWIMGIDVSWGSPLSLYVQHRMQKAFKNDGIHSVEIGIKYSPDFRVRASSR